MVAPFAGAWIEIMYGMMVTKNITDVAPFAGAWIEMTSNFLKVRCLYRRSLRGSVD